MYVCCLISNIQTVCAVCASRTGESKIVLSGHESLVALWVGAPWSQDLPRNGRYQHGGIVVICGDIWLEIIEYYWNIIGILEEYWWITLRKSNMASWEISLFSGHQWKIHRTKWWIFMIFQCYAWLLEAILIGKWWSTIDFVLGSPISGRIHLLNWRGPVLLFRECAPSNHQMLQFKSIDILTSKLIFLSESGNFQATWVYLQIAYPTFLRVTIFLTRAVWWGPSTILRQTYASGKSVRGMHDHHDLARIHAYGIHL